jgi:hypothetical protein
MKTKSGRTRIKFVIIENYRGKSIIGSMIVCHNACISYLHMLF